MTLLPAPRGPSHEEAACSRRTCFGLTFLQHRVLPKDRRDHAPQLGVDGTPTAPSVLLPGPTRIARTSLQCPLPPRSTLPNKYRHLLSFLNKAQLLSLGPALVLCRIVYLHLKWFLRKGNCTHHFTYVSSLVSSAQSCYVSRTHAGYRQWEGDTRWTQAVGGGLGCGWESMKGRRVFHNTVVMSSFLSDELGLQCE